VNDQAGFALFHAWNNGWQQVSMNSSRAFRQPFNAGFTLFSQLCFNYLQGIVNLQ